MRKRSQILSLLGVAVISGAIFYLTQGVQEEQSIKTQASSSVARVYISPEDQTLPPAATFSVFADLPIAAKEVTLHLKYDNSLLSLTKAPVGADSYNLSSVSSIEEANNSGELEIKLTSDNELVTGVVQLASLEFDAIEEEVLQTTIHLSSENIVLAGFEGQVIPEEVEHASISIRPQE